MKRYPLNSWEELICIAGKEKRRFNFVIWVKYKNTKKVEIFFLSSFRTSGVTDYYALDDFHALHQARQCVKNLNYRKALPVRKIIFQQFITITSTFLFFHMYWDLFTKTTVNVILTDFNRRSTEDKISLGHIVRPISNANGKISLWQNIVCPISNANGKISLWQNIVRPISNMNDKISLWQNIVRSISNANDKIPAVMNERAKRELQPTAVALITARFEKWPNEGLLLFAELRLYLKTRKQKPNIKFE